MEYDFMNGEQQQVDQPPPEQHPPEERAKEQERTAAFQENDPNKYDANKGLLEAAKDFFFIADDAGEPAVSLADNGIVHMLWPDNSIVTVRFEHRPGELGAVGPRAVNDENRKARNEGFSKAKRDREELAKRSVDIKREQKERSVEAKEKDSRL